jgi:predicted O-methyltransferase YrrM
MSFTEAWYHPLGLLALERAFRLSRGVTGAVIEVGCWEGRSTCTLANVAYPQMIHAVDTWEGSPGEISEGLAKERNVFATFVENIQQLTFGNVQAHVMSWQDYFERFPNPVRFIHIDAEHTYEQVRDNIETVLPLLVPGGVICGDDAHHPPVISAARDVLGDITIDMSLWWWQNNGD